MRNEDDRIEILFSIYIKFIMPLYKVRHSEREGENINISYSRISNCISIVRYNRWRDKRGREYRFGYFKDT